MFIAQEAWQLSHAILRQYKCYGPQNDFVSYHKNIKVCNLKPRGNTCILLSKLSIVKNQAGSLDTRSMCTCIYCAGFESCFRPSFAPTSRVSEVCAQLRHLACPKLNSDFVSLVPLINCGVTTRVLYVVVQKCKTRLVVCLQSDVSLTFCHTACGSVPFRMFGMPVARPHRLSRIKQSQRTDRLFSAPMGWRGKHTEWQP